MTTGQARTFLHRMHDLESELVHNEAEVIRGAEHRRKWAAAILLVVVVLPLAAFASTRTILATDTPLLVSLEQARIDHGRVQIFLKLDNPRAQLLEMKLGELSALLMTRDGRMIRTQLMPVYFKTGEIRLLVEPDSKALKAGPCDLTLNLAGERVQAKPIPIRAIET